MVGLLVNGPKVVQAGGGGGCGGRGGLRGGGGVVCLVAWEGVLLVAGGEDNWVVEMLWALGLAGLVAGRYPGGLEIGVVMSGQGLLGTGPGHLRSSAAAAAAAAAE
jgi:hypothetical protein